MTHVVKATDMFSGLDCIFLVEQLFMILCLQRRHAATAAVTVATQSSMPLSNLHEVSVFEGNLNFSVQGTPLSTTHREGLLLRVGTLSCAPTYNRGVVQHVGFDRFGLVQLHECSSKAATFHANSTVQVACNSI